MVLERIVYLIPGATLDEDLSAFGQELNDLAIRFVIITRIPGGLALLLAVGGEFLRAGHPEDNERRTISGLNLGIGTKVADN